MPAVPAAASRAELLFELLQLGGSCLSFAQQADKLGPDELEYLRLLQPEKLDSLKETLVGYEQTQWAELKARCLAQLPGRLENVAQFEELCELCEPRVSVLQLQLDHLLLCHQAASILGSSSFRPVIREVPMPPPAAAPPAPTQTATSSSSTSTREQQSKPPRTEWQSAGAPTHNATAEREGFSGEHSGESDNSNNGGSGEHSGESDNSNNGGSSSSSSSSSSNISSSSSSRRDDCSAVKMDRTTTARKWKMTRAEIIGTLKRRGVTRSHVALPKLELA
jgi:uncharacterized membrane protein YgcG